MSIAMIVAKTNNNVIGQDNKLLWNIPEDMRYFKNTTMGKTVVMGRLTYESIGKPLPGRRNIVLSRNKDLWIDGVDVVHDVEEIINLSKKEDIMIIGGDSIYKIFMDYASVLYVTDIEVELDGDAYFPKIDESWKLTSKIEGKDSGKNYKYFFKKYVKV